MADAECRLTQMYKQYSTTVFNFLVYFTGDRYLAEDLAQETFLRVMRHHSSFQGRSSEKTWILQIAKNVAIDWSRRMRFLPKPSYEADQFDQSSVTASAEDLVLDCEEVKQIMSAIRTLRPQYRLAVVLRGIEGLPTSQVAEILKWSEAKVKTTFHRGRRELIKRLEEKGVGEYASL